MRFTASMATTAPAITGVDFVCIPTQDFDAAADFYRDVLGLEFVKRWGSMPAAEFQAGNLTLAVMDPTAFGQEYRRNSVPVAFQVEDVEESRAALEAQDVEFIRDTIDSGVCLQALFKDPDGNPLILHHRYAPKPS